MAENKSGKAKVSVIIPIFRSEHYLRRCCLSLFAQTLQEIEYIFILDGPSSEAEIIINKELSDFPCRKEWVRIIRHSKNQGISYCRQEGHESARGEFIYHCDSDDTMALDALETLYIRAVAEDADLVFADYARLYQQSGKEIVYSSKHVLEGTINTLDGTLCNKLIRRSLIVENGLIFPSDINWGEDMCMSVMLQISAHKISYIPHIIYYYYIHSDSITTGLNRERYLQLVSCPSFLERELNNRGLLASYLMLLRKMKFEVKEYFLIQRSLRDLGMWKRLYPEIHPFIWQFSEVPLYLKCVAWLLVHGMTPMARFLLQCRDLYVMLRGYGIK